MALARLVTFTPLTLIKSADVNGEFNNILSNPIALISPSTGAINFNLQAHTNLVSSALSATSGSTGNVLTVSAAGSPVWAAPGSVLTTTPKVLQIISGSALGPVNAATTSFADAGISITITPTSTNSRFAVNYSGAGQALGLTGVNNNYQAQIATTTGAVPGTVMTVAAGSGSGGLSATATVAWTVIMTTTQTGAVAVKLQHLFTASSGANAGNISNFNGYIVEYSS